MGLFLEGLIWIYSTVTECSPTDGILSSINLNNVNHNLVVNVRLTSSNLWLSPYSEYQQKLFDIISGFHEKDGWSFKEISNWLVEHNYKTPRGRTFTLQHTWSMYSKKKKSIERFKRKYEPIIKEVKIDYLG